MLDHSLGELAPGIIRGMFSKASTEQTPAARQSEADREHQLSAKRAMVQARPLAASPRRDILHLA
jgi:hypothetical protein